MTEQSIRLNGNGQSSSEQNKGSIGSIAEYEEGALYVSDPSLRCYGGVATITPPFQPLKNTWTFWFDTPSSKIKQSAWGSSMRKIHTICTVEDFWSLHNSLHPPSKLIMGSDLYCFKHYIEPKWEDPICENGGKWTIISQRLKADGWWLRTLLAVLGEQFLHGDIICGVVINVRSKQEKISIWTKNAADEASQLSLGKQWKAFLGCVEQIGFIVHDDAKKFDRLAKIRYCI